MTLYNKLTDEDYSRICSSDSAHSLMSSPLPNPFRRVKIDTYSSPLEERNGQKIRQVYSTITYSSLFLDNISSIISDKDDLLENFIDICHSKEMPQGLSLDIEYFGKNPHLAVSQRGHRLATIIIEDYDGVQISVKAAMDSTPATPEEQLKAKIDLSIYLLKNVLLLLSKDVPSLSKFIKSNPPLFLELSEESKALPNSLADPRLIEEVENAVSWDAKMTDALIAAHRGTHRQEEIAISSEIISMLALAKSGDLKGSEKLIETKGLPRLESEKLQSSLLGSTLKEALVVLLALIRDAERNNTTLDKYTVEKIDNIIRAVLPNNPKGDAGKVK